MMLSFCPSPKSVLFVRAWWGLCCFHAPCREIWAFHPCSLAGGHRLRQLCENVTISTSSNCRL